MRKLVVLTFLSLDGVMQAPGGPDEDTSDGFKFGGWTVPFSDEALGEVMSKQMSKQADLLLGRKTYDIFAGYWPQHADNWPGINDVKKYVASHRAIELSWKNSVLLREVVSAVRKLKSESGPDLHVYGSGNLMQTLLKHDLVDELWLKIFPITLGHGKRLFDGGAIPAAFKLLECTVTPSGVIAANYARAGDVQTGSFD